MPANVEGMVQEAIRAYRAGNKQEAHTLLGKATELDPYNEQAWMWLSAVVELPEDQRVCLENVLYINPDNENAKRGLNILTSKYGENLSTQTGTHRLIDLEEPLADSPFSNESEWIDDPPTATSSPSAAYNPANEISKDQYDDWVSGLNLGGSSESPAQHDEVDDNTFANVFAGAFDDDFNDSDFIDSDDDDLQLDDLREDDFSFSSSGAGGLFVDDDDDDTDFTSGPFSSQSLDIEPPPAPAPAPARRSPPSPGRGSPASPVSPAESNAFSGGGLFVDTSPGQAEEIDPGEYFRAIPKVIKPTRLPGTNEKYPPLVILGLVTLVVLNLAALGFLLQNLM